MTSRFFFTARSVSISLCALCVAFPSHGEHEKTFAKQRRSESEYYREDLGRLARSESSAGEDLQRVRGRVTESWQTTDIFGATLEFYGKAPADRLIG